MTLQEFLGQCQELESRGDVNAGLLLCDQLLDRGVRGRLRVNALRYKALFLMLANPGWVTVAVAHLKEALAMTRRHPAERGDILQVLVAVYAMAGSSDMARRYLDQFMALAGEAATDSILRLIPRIWFSMGYAYEAAGEYRNAEDAYRRSLEVVHLDSGRLTPALVKLNLAQVLVVLGNVDAAMPLLAESRLHLDLNRFGSFLMDEEAQCYLAKGRYEDAWRSCREALEHPSCTERIQAHVYFTMARVAYAQGRYQEAVDLAERALGLAIKNPVARLIQRIEVLRIDLSTKKEVS